MSSFVQDQPRETHYTIAFRRHPLPEPRPGFWRRLWAGSSEASSAFAADDAWADALLAEIGARFGDQGWPWTTGPWAFYEPDYRIETTAEGERVVLILVTPNDEEEGSIWTEDPKGAPISEEITGRVIAVVRAVLQGRAEVYELQEYPTWEAWRAAWEAKRSEGPPHERSSGG